jgi:hypothetical protein
MSGMICQFNHEFCKSLTNFILKEKKNQEHKDAIPPNFTRKVQDAWPKYFKKEAMKFVCQKASSPQRLRIIYL